MKKLIITIFLLLLIIVPSNFINAQTYETYSITNSEIGISISLYNTTTADLNGDIVVGIPLANYMAMGKIKENGFETTVSLSWDNPEYIIQEGGQTLTLKLIRFNNEYLFNINVTGISPEANTTLPKKAIQKVNIFSSLDSITKTFNGTLGEDIKDIIPKFYAWSNDSTDIAGSFIVNTNNLVLGLNNVEWTFEPNNSKYNSLSGTINVLLNEAKTSEDNFPTTLTATSLLLNEGSTYDINLNDKVNGAKYAWKSSNTKVAKVNSKNGVVTAIEDGEAIITCTVTTTDGNIYNLTSNVYVGIDDNFPVLTDDELELTIGEKYDIDVENQIVKSKYKWTTSDKTVVKVNSTTGVITAVKSGEANIYCTISAPNKQIVVLKCEVTVE